MTKDLIIFRRLYDYKVLDMTQMQSVVIIQEEPALGIIGPASIIGHYDLHDLFLRRAFL